MRSKLTRVMGFISPWTAAGIGFAVLTVGAAAVHACFGSPQPPCSRSAYVAKFVTSTVVHPGNNAPIMIPVGLVPNVTWNDGGFCASPISASMTLTAQCTSLTTGAVFNNVAPQPVAVGVPLSPGPQRVNGVLGGAHNFIIPAGTLPAGDQYRCTFTGNYTVTFGAGVGSGSITGTGDATVCIVDPSPADATQPRLLAYRADRGDNGLTICRRGDQLISYYVIGNNDPVESVVLTVTASTDQVARMPVSSSITTTHSIALDTPGTDNFPVVFADALDPGAVVEETDPFDIDLLDPTEHCFLGPGEIAVIPIRVKPFGMCADGSCTEDTVDVFGRFIESGDLAVGCVGSATLVDDGLADSGMSTPLCEIVDSVFAAQDQDVTASPGHINRDHMLTTLASGNLLTNELRTFDPRDFPRGTRVPGDFVQSGFGIQEFESSVDSYVRTTQGLERVDYTLNSDIYDANSGASSPDDLTYLGTTINHVTVTNIGDQVNDPVTGGSFSIPLVRSAGNPNAELSVNHNFDGSRFTIKDGKKTLFNGNTSQFFETSSNPNSKIEVDFGTGRGFFKSPAQPGALAEARPAAITLIPSQVSGTFVQGPTIVDPRASDGVGSGTAGTVTTNQDLFFLEDSTASYGQSIDMNISHINPSIAPDLPDVRILNVNTPGAAFNRVEALVVVRDTFPGAEQDAPMSIKKTKGKIQRKKPEKPRDSFSITLNVPIEESFGFEDNKRFVISVNGFVREFILDEKLKPKNKKGRNDKLKIKFKSKGGMVPAQDAQVTYSFKKEDISGRFANLGIFDTNLPKGTFRQLRVRVYFCGKRFKTTGLLDVKSKQGKSASFKNAKDTSSR